MKKTIALLLAVSLLCPLFAACGDKEQPDPATGSSETTVQTEPPEDAPDYAALETLGDISGEFRILFGYGFKQNDFKAAEESSTALESAIYRRNAYMKEKYNIDIVTDEMDSRTQAYDKLFAEYNAGDSTYDAAMMRTAEVAKLASGGCLRDLNEMPHLDLTKDYWDQRANADLSIGGRMYYTTGDIGVVDNMCTHCMLFNKEMVRQYGFDDPYELVKDDKWTLETLGTMVRAVGEDANQDGVYDENDVYGLLTWLDNVQAILAGAGERVCKVNDNGELVLTLYNERVVNLYDDFTALVYDESHVFNYQYDRKTADRSPVDVWDKNRVNMFNNNQAMFYFTMLTTVPRHRDSTTDFGILPYPKYDESQKDYGHGIGVNQTAFICVPEMVTNDARTGFVLEELSYQGKKLLTPAYYEQTLIGQYTRDEESADMLDLIFATRVYDVGLYYNIGKYKDALANMFVNRRTLTTVYETYRESAETTIAEINAAFASQFGAESADGQ